MDTRFFVFTLVIYVPFVSGKCTLDVNKDYNVSSPLFLSRNTLDIVYPEKTSPKYLSFKSGEEQLIHCTGGWITRHNVSIDLTSEVAKCVNGLTFANPAKHLEYPFSQLSCSKNPVPVTREDENRKCRNGVIVDIGYQVTPTVFKRTIDLCHIKNLATTSWAHAKIHSAIGGNRNRQSTSPAFSKGSYFNDVLISQVYPRSYQYRTFMGIFKNDAKLVDRYLPKDGDKKNYFVKGHLVARADMFYHAEQWSTYFYVNVLPMWQSINNGNWKSVESTVRRLASIIGDLDVWTGGIGVLNLDGKDIYLSRDKKNVSRPLVPAPKLLYKLVHTDSKNEALVFVTVNNPHIDTELPKEYRICPEYKTCADKFPNFKKFFEGYTYCCLYDDFAKSSVYKHLDIPADLQNVKPLTLN